MFQAFITLRFLDVIDIMLFAFLLYEIYMLLRGSVAINIFFGIFVVYLVYLVVRGLRMQLLSSMLGQFIGVGVIALIIVFQQELRRFLLLLGTHELLSRKFSFQRFLNPGISATSSTSIKAIVLACRNLAKTNTGALIVMATQSDLRQYSQTGEAINADINNRLLESLFFKNSPLHDGAIIVVGNKIKAAKCILPVHEELNLPEEVGLRHRAAVSMSSESDALVLIVSEERGKISYARGGTLKTDIDSIELTHLLKETYKQDE